MKTNKHNSINTSGEETYLLAGGAQNNRFRIMNLGDIEQNSAVYQTRTNFSGGLFQPNRSGSTCFDGWYNLISSCCMFSIAIAVLDLAIVSISIVSSCPENGETFSLSDDMGYHTYKAPSCPDGGDDDAYDDTCIFWCDQEAQLNIVASVAAVLIALTCSFGAARAVICPR